MSRFLLRGLTAAMVGGIPALAGLVISNEYLGDDQQHYLPLQPCESERIQQRYCDADQHLHDQL